MSNERNFSLGAIRPRCNGRIVLYIENLIRIDEFNFIDHDIWRVLWRRVEQLVHIQSNSNCWNFLSVKAINVLFSCVEKLGYSGKLNVENLVKNDGLIISVAKSVIEYCPNTLGSLVAIFEHFKNLQTESNINSTHYSFINILYSTKIISKVKLPKQITQLNFPIVFIILKFWKRLLEFSNPESLDLNKLRPEILEIIFKNLPPNLEILTTKLNCRDEISSENILYLMTEMARSGKKRHLALAVKMLIGKG